MIRVTLVKCLEDFIFCGKKFEKECVYKSYIINGRYIVIKDGYGIPFDIIIRGRLKSGENIKLYKNFFEEKSVDYVKNKSELKAWKNR